MTEPNETISEAELSLRKRISAPPKFTIRKDMIVLLHSFGYDCKRLFNLWLIDDDTLAFASGNFIHYFKISSQQVTFRETFSGGGIGFMTKNEHPDFQGLLTIGENGPSPTVFIYEYPSHEVRYRLLDAAKTCFTCGSYNSTGELFASQAGHPDFMLTIWRWQTAEVILRAKAFQSDVLHVHFSNFNPILLASCGLSHIKFWKMANTFTGLKLKGDLGRFGKTDFSDIYAIYMLSDENVISGCDWGNMLLWEAGLIKFEICRKGRKPCHLKPITRITMDKHGEVTTVGMDGYVRIWYWETVELADPPDDDRFVEIEPIYEFKIGDCEIRGIQKIKPFDDKHFGYYVQDGKGGIWHCELNTYDEARPPRKIYSCPGGKVIVAQPSYISPHFLALDETGKLFLYDYDAKTLLMAYNLPTVATDLVWFNTKISKSGMEIVVGFVDGIFRHYLLDITDVKHAQVHLVHAIKGHTAAVTKIGVNPQNTILVTGSADKTIFMYYIGDKVQGLVHIKPIGFVQFDAIPCAFNWKRDKKTIILVGGKGGEVYEYTMPYKLSEDQTFLTYRLADSRRMESIKFVSVKSRIRRDIRRAQIKQRKEAKRKRKLTEIEKLKAANPGLQIDMETALADSEPEEEEDPLYTPPVPNPILWLRYSPLDTIWLSMAGYDAGYIYEFTFGSQEPVRSTIIKDGDDCEIHSYLEINDYLIFGLINGKVRINRTRPHDFTELHDYRLYDMHDALNGCIPNIFHSYAGKYIFSVGHDGNIFMYKWNGPAVSLGDPLEDGQMPKLSIEAYDIDDPGHPSLEQEKIYAEMKRQEEAAAAHDRKILGHIAELQVKFDEIVLMNEALPKELQIPQSDMLLDERITRQIATELQAELDDVREDLAYDLEVAQLGKKKLYDYFLKPLDHVPLKIGGIGTSEMLYSFRLEALGEEFEKINEDIADRLFSEGKRRRTTALTGRDDGEASIKEPGSESFFFGRDPSTIIPRFSKKMLRLLRQYRSRQYYEVERIFRWSRLENEKPDPNRNHPDDEEKIDYAERHIGDYKLKIGAEYEPPLEENLTRKYIEVVETRENFFNIYKDYNDKVFQLRKHKKEMYEYIDQSRKRLEALHVLIPEQNRLYLPEIPEINESEEYPELNLIQHYQPSCGIEIKDILYLEKMIKDFLPKTPTESRSNQHLTEHRMQELETYFALRMQDLNYLPDNDDLIEELSKLPKFDEPGYYESQDGEPCPWLVKTRYCWLMKILDMQQTIITNVQKRINKFNSYFNDLCYSRVEVKYQGEFLQCYMITLNQELYILRDSEEIENRLVNNGETAMKSRNHIQIAINACNRQIEEGRKIGDKINDQISTIQLKFMTTIKGHKFFDFLRRIFKKKYRPPKPPKGDDESSESSSSDESSSEDEEDDTKSIDSTDMTTIRLDETHCPPGLERSMYDLAFKMRSERHGMEQTLLEQQKLIETKRTEVSVLQKNMKYHEDVYAKEKDSLLVFKRRRQHELNKVQTAVILNMNQIQHFLEGHDFRDLSKAVLFNGNNLKKLRQRVEQLNVEADETKRVHRINFVHLRRMNADIKFMNFEIKRLEELIKDEMMKKFGIIIDLDELEEEVLRKYVFELETTAEDELKLIEKEYERKKLQLSQLQQALILETQANTNKVNVLEVLQEEKNFLDEILAAQEKNYEKWFKPQSFNLDRDIERLLAIDKQQKEQMEYLEREICTLRMKSKPFQMDMQPKETNVCEEILPEDDPNVCPEMLAADAYQLRSVPDDFAMERVLKIVQRCVNKHLMTLMSKNNIRKYSQSIARYLGQAAYSFEGQVTDRILDCITESMENILPKKYLMHISSSDLSKLFNEVLAVFDYERSEVNTEDVISGIYANAVRSLDEGELNKTQHILDHMFKELIEVLPIEEFRSEETQRLMIALLEKENIIDARCICIEPLVESVINYAKHNLLDGITAVPIRRLAEALHKDLLKHRRSSRSAVTCSIGSVASVTISAKK